MRVRRFRLCLICILGASLLQLQLAGAQESARSLDGQFPPINELQELTGGLFDSTNGNEVSVSASLQVDSAGSTGQLSVTAKLAPSWHIYSVTQKSGGPMRTEIRLEPSNEYELSGPFQPDKAPEVSTPEFFPVPVEEHKSDVTWTAPIRITDGVDPKDIRIAGKLQGQVCQEHGACIPLSQRDTSFVARSASDVAEEPPPVMSEKSGFRAPETHAVLSGTLSASTLRPGQSARIVITARPDAHWHIYALRSETDRSEWYNPTTIGLQLPTGWTVTKPIASATPVEQENPLKGEPPLFHHEDPVSWSFKVHVPKDTEAGSYEISGLIGYQTCSQACDLPTSARFSVPITVSDAPQTTGETPVAFLAQARYDEAVAAHNNTNFYSVDTDKKTPAVAGLPRIAWIMVLAFLAGLILNVMPCVLPVIGLKILSFVQQAGEDRSRILALNLWFSFGLLSVFMALATGAAFLKLGWGQHLQSVGFSVTLTGIVFVFALSFLGVWEIPIPGFVGGTKASALAQKEGPAGAFSKGMLTTILATPCSGPLLIPTVSWAVGQPPWITYLTFFFIGLGMASPYLVIGVFPRAIGLLPKPGAWMDTFKQSMGFVLLATVVYLFSTLDAEEYAVPLLTLLLGLGVACWYVGRTPLTAALSTQFRAWSVAVGMILATAWFSFNWLRSGVELDWRPYDRLALMTYVDQGHTVLVDFTADW